MGMVKWSQRTADGVAVRGMMPEDKAQRELLYFGNVAKDILNEVGSDHVLYGLKIFEGLQLKAVHFYMWPMNDEEFKRITGRLNNSMVYAVHRN